MGTNKTGSVKVADSQTGNGGLMYNIQRLSEELFSLVRLLL